MYVHRLIDEWSDFDFFNSIPNYELDDFLKDWPLYAVEVLEDGGCLCSAVGHNGLITNDEKVSQKYISTLVSNQDFI